MFDETVKQALVDAARQMESSRDVDAVLHTIVTVARDSLPEIDHAGISFAHRDGRVETVAAAGDLVEVFDGLQYELGEGPCLWAMDGSTHEDVVTVDHARDEQRWSRYIPRAVEHGLRSQLGIRLYADENTIGGLNLYSTSHDVIEHETRFLAELLATQAALALERVRRENNLEKAIAARSLVGQAVGVIMERYKLSEDRATDYLLRVSQSGNIKLRTLAEGIVAEFNGHKSSH